MKTKRFLSLVLLSAVVVSALGLVQKPRNTKAK